MTETATDCRYPLTADMRRIAAGTWPATQLGLVAPTPKFFTGIENSFNRLVLTRTGLDKDALHFSCG